MRAAACFAAAITIFAVSGAAQQQPRRGAIAGDARITGAAREEARKILATATPLAPNTPCIAGEARCNVTNSGRISLDSCFTEGNYSVAYSFMGTLGQQITASVTAQTPVIMGLFDPAENMVADAMTTQPGATAQFTYTLQSTGNFTFIIMAIQEFAFGDYTFTVSCGTTGGEPCSDAVPMYACPTSMIAGEITTSDCKDDYGWPMDRYRIVLEKNDTFSVEASAGFPVWLNLQEPEDRGGLYAGGTTNEALSFTAPEDMELLLVVTPWNASDTGSYTLAFDCGTVAPCRRRGIRPPGHD